jgi:ribulose-bisphosphate carboxylase large chain
MHGAITRNKDLGVSMVVFAKLVRMCGGDALHVGTFGVGKMKDSSAEDLANQRACVGPELPYEKVMPVCSGGMHPALIEPLVKITGTNVQIQAGGGVAGHPGGVRSGARAMVQAVEAAYQGIPFSEYSKSHQELREAINKWG